MTETSSVSRFYENYDVSGHFRSRRRSQKREKTGWEFPADFPVCGCLTAGTGTGIVKNTGIPTKTGPGALSTILLEFTVYGNTPLTETLRSEKRLPSALIWNSPWNTVVHITIGVLCGVSFSVTDTSVQCIFSFKLEQIIL